MPLVNDCLSNLSSGGVITQENCSLSSPQWRDVPERKRWYSDVTSAIKQSFLYGDDVKGNEGGSQGLPNDLMTYGKSSSLLAMDQDFRKLEKHGRLHHLNRRIASVMVPLRERESTALCTYEVTTDINPRRVPDKIDRVLCRKDSCNCAEQGDFRCTQLYTQLNVTYLSANCQTNLEFELIDVEYACVCSKAVEGSSVNLLEPVLV